LTSERCFAQDQERGTEVLLFSDANLVTEAGKQSVLDLGVPLEGGAQVLHRSDVLLTLRQGIQATERLPHGLVLGVAIIGLRRSDQSGDQGVDLALLEVEVNAQRLLQAAQHLSPRIVTPCAGEVLQQLVDFAMVLLEQGEGIGRR